MSKYSRKLQKLHDTAPKQETAVLVALIRQGQSDVQVNEYLEELAFLTETLGAKTVYRFTQRLERPDVKTFVGSGKLEEIQAYIEHFGVDMVIFDDDLSPSQMRNLENELKIKVYDRSLLILDIFLKRAQTAQAKTQVELARFQYLLPRLTRMWTHLERQRGGTGTRGGAGEKEIETDKRDIRNKITSLKEKLKEIEKQGVTQRKGRKGIVRAALVGYTNVGKSTLMNLMTKLGVTMTELAEKPRELLILDENGEPIKAGDNARRFFEAAWMHKYNGKYYLSYSTGDTHFIAYAIGDSPYGPFTYQGNVLEPVEGWTNHHSIVEFQGKWYLFYHDTELSGKTPLRNIKMAELTHLPIS